MNECVGEVLECECCFDCGGFVFCDDYMFVIVYGCDCMVVWWFWYLGCFEWGLWVF